MPSTIVVPKGIHPFRYQISLHELGHITVWERVPGARLKDARVTDKLIISHNEGYVDMHWPKPLPQDDATVRTCLAGHLAGYETDRIWCERTGEKPDKGHSAHDFSVFHHRLTNYAREYKPARRWTERDLAAEARRICLSDWDSMLRRAAVLARRGRL